MTVQPLRFLLVLFAGLVNRRQADVIEYLQQENRVLREQLGGVGSIVTPDTILRWYRMLIANKYDGCFKRGPGPASHCAADS